MRCKAPSTGTNILMEPCGQNAKAWSPVGISDRKNEICPAAFSVAFEFLNLIGIGSNESFGPFVDCKRYRAQIVRDNIAVVAGDHDHFLITYLTNDQVVNSMWSTSVQKPSETWPTSGKVDDKLWLRGNGLFGEAGRIDVDFVDVGNK